MEWLPIESAPRDGTAVRLQFANGNTAVGEYWPAPPKEIDPDQTCQGWAVCLIEDGLEGLGLDCLDIGEPTAWQPIPPPHDSREG